MTSTPTVVIIADGLTNDFLSPRDEFLGCRVNAGVAEIDRLLGAGEEFGRGPLPAFLLAAAEARRQGKKIHLVFLRDLHDPDDEWQQGELLRYGEHSIRGSEGAEFLPLFAGLTGSGFEITTSTLAMPALAFQRVMQQILDRDLADLAPEERARVQFVVVGVHTDLRLFQIACRLRHDYQFPAVFVCPHLVGARNRQAQMTTLQVHFPNALIQVIPGLPRLAERIGLAGLPHFPWCEDLLLEPPEIRDRLPADARGILESLFIGFSQVRLTALSGGFSGNGLFLVDGWKGTATTVPVIVKIGPHQALQREIQGYHLVAERLGPHVPALDPPVSVGGLTGLRMGLAAMEGSARTLQSLFPRSDGTGNARTFQERLERALDLLVTRLYRNPLQRRLLYPYREFDLHQPRQEGWFRDNLQAILPGADLDAATWELGPGVVVPGGYRLFQRLRVHDDRQPALTCLCHGDLNLANLLTDNRGNLWAIDWAYGAERPVETDFAKLENDVKFVAAKDFTLADLPDLLAMERIFLAHPEIPPLETVPGAPAWAGDARFRCVYEAVGAIRRALGRLGGERQEEWYRLALLRFALHTLSFDERRGKGECRLPSLMYALLSVCLHLEWLKGSPWHCEGPQGRPDEYPPRLPVPVADRAWSRSLTDYRPPVYDSPTVLSQAEKPDGWADPDDWRQARLRSRWPTEWPDLAFDLKGRPLNPLGRTGLAGRGLLGRWGPNLAVDPVVSRFHPGHGRWETVLMKRSDTGEWALPGTMVRPGETAQEAGDRSLRERTGLVLPLEGGIPLPPLVMDDFRNTDHAWIETTGLLIHLPGCPENGWALRPGGLARDVAWQEVSPLLVRRLFASHAAILRQALERLLGQVAERERERLLRLREVL